MIEAGNIISFARICGVHLLREEAAHIAKMAEKRPNMSLNQLSSIIRRSKGVFPKRKPKLGHCSGEMRLRKESQRKLREYLEKNPELMQLV